jgi:FkbM family methyltransferase
MKLQDVVSGKVKLHPFGVGVKEGSFDFYGLDASEGGCYSQGGSLVQWHNSDRYTASPERAVKVNVINFSTYLKGKAAEFDKIFVKMDIEGAEVELLEALLKEQTANLISTLYVEFHSQYQSENLSLQTRDREQKILDDLANKTDVNVRIWH